MRIGAERMITVAQVDARSVGDRLPLVTLDEFFDGNDREDSLAPNRLGEGRPPLAAIAERLRTAQDDARIAWIRVELTDADTDGPAVVGADADRSGTGGAIQGESVVIGTTGSAAELEDLLDVEWLRSDGIFESDESSLEDVCEVPPLEGHQRIVFLVWD